MKITCNVYDEFCQIEAEFFFTIISIKDEGENEEIKIYSSCSFHKNDIARDFLYNYKKKYISKEKYMKLIIIK